MKVFIINMDKDKDRKKHVLAECATRGISPEVISAVNGRDILKNELEELIHPILSQGLTASEIGCSLSHLKAYNKMIEDNIPLALILEDDVQLDESINNILKYIEDTPFYSPTVILLSEIRKFMKIGKKKIDNRYHLVDTTQASLAHCYVINLEGAKSLVNFLTPIWLEADRWTLFQEYGAINIKAIIPPVGHLSSHSETSTIWPTQEELDKKHDIRITRSKIIIKIRRSRPFIKKLKTVLWRTFVRKIFEVEGEK